jgi:transglutaminase-like putative cysteine protease
MPSPARRLAAAALALVVVGAAWLRLEDPFAPLWRVLALVGLALAAAAVPRPAWRAIAAFAATIAAAWLAVGVSLLPTRPLDPDSGFGLGRPFAALGTRFGNGFSDFYATHLPFDPRVHGAMGELVLVAIFCFALLVAVLAAARKPVACALALLAGAGWPATLLGPSHGLEMGAAILAAALVVLAGLGSRRLPALALPAAAVVAAGAVAVGSATAAGHGLVHWQTWNPAHIASGPVDVGFVWNAQYGGLDWQRQGRSRVVLDVQSANPPSYLRAAVLDDFLGNAWAVGPPRAADALEPAAALLTANEERETVTVQGLADTHLVGGTVPVRFAAGDAPLTRPERGFADLPEGMPAGFRYTVWSYAAQPTAAELNASAPDYPSALTEDGLLDVGRDATLPPFGAPHRAATVLGLVALQPQLHQYLPLARLAEQVAARARSPYEAVADLERWFLSSGGFRYSNHPQVIAPALVGFVTQTRTGYCQFFAGAMALMLRYLGIPARVAVGFAGGKYDPSRNAWAITDRDAHAWVEVWFKGFGWLAVDPTPATSASARDPRASLPSAHGTGGAPAAASVRGAAAKLRATQQPTNGPESRVRQPDRGVGEPSQAGAGPTGRGRGMVALLVLLVAASSLGGILVTKLGLRAVRRAARDPRRVAAACRRELSAFLVDQGIDVDGSATLHELGDRLRREFGVDPREFVAAATAARYGRTDLADGAARDARRELEALLSAMRRGLTRRERLRGLFSLRSLGRPSAAVARSASLSGEIVGASGS